MFSPTSAQIRRRFPALERDLVFFENAGGSQVPRVVAEAVSAHLLERYVQLGAPYDLSRAATAVVDDAHAFVERLMGAPPRSVILGSASTALLSVLADAYRRRRMGPPRRIVLAQNGHEANLGPWRKLSSNGTEIVIWRADPVRGHCDTDDLRKLLDRRTDLVCFPHVSNLLGEIADVEEITRLCHEQGARVVVDGVAYAPHRRMQVQRWQVDWYVFSTYKVYGPHLAALYGRADALGELVGPNHFFVPDDDLPYKFELGGVSHEACAGLLGLESYLAWLGGAPEAETVDGESIDRAFERMTALEAEPTRRLLDLLNDEPGVRIVGPPEADESRVGTVSFVHEALSSRQITETLVQHGFAVRFGHMYAYELCQALGLDPEDGVVRLSLVHYNTVEEVERLGKALVPALSHER